MAIVQRGKPLLTAAELLPGWTVSYDGFGLVTSTTRFKSDWAFNTESIGARGTAHPDAAYSYLKAAKHQTSWDANRIATITVDYVGIDPEINSGATTIPNTSAANGLTTENITSHPNFFTAAAGYVAAIAGPSPYAESDKGPIVTRSDGKPGKSYVSTLKGACFERPNGGRFIGFVDPAFPNYYGKTNYLATTTTYSGVMYARDVTTVQALLGLLNTATSTRAWGTFTLIPAWAPIGAVGGHNVNLLSQVNVEEYGSLYKVMYEIRYSKTGWDKDTYINITA
jgi:hypothetical protein